MTLEDDELRAAVEELASECDSDGDDGTSDDEGDVALLGLDRQLRGRELEEKSQRSTWGQVRDIVIEVRPTRVTGRSESLGEPAAD